MKSMRKDDNHAGKLKSSGCKAPGRYAPALTAALVLALSLTISLAPCESVAESNPQQTAVAYQDGTITGLYETTLQIDHKTYSLTPDAVLLDRHGDELGVKHLKVDIQVKFHLEKGSTDKIDRMVLYLPY